MRLTHQTFSQQIPEFIRDGYPQFLEFVRQYYRFLDQIAMYDVGDALDLDNSPDVIIDEFYKSYAKGLPVPVSFSKREFLRHCKEFYSAKGTPASFNFLFKAFFDKTADITTPGDQMMRLSDGRWEQLCSIDVQVTFGDPTPHFYAGATIELTNTLGIYSIIIESVETTVPNVYRIYFKRGELLRLEDGQITTIFNTDGVLQLKFKLIQRPISLTVLTPGSGWQYGSTIVIPGTIKDTFARVIAVQGTGIKTLEIIEHGYGHSNGDTYYCSPYVNTPSQTEHTITKVQGSGTVAYTLNVHEYLPPFKSSIQVTKTNTQGSSSFSQVYAGSKSAGVVNQNLTYQGWVNSLANIEVTYGLIAFHTGRYSDNKSLVSEPYSKIQDNKIYQIYSYLINSEVDEKQYKQALGLIHPAGLARFGEIVKQSEFDNSNSIYVDGIKEYVILHEDDLVIAEDIAKNVTKILSETFTVADSIAFTITKPMVTDNIGFATETALYEAPSPYASGDIFLSDYNASVHTLIIN